MNNPHQRTNAFNVTEFSDGDFWMGDRDCCNHCREEREAAGLPYRWADEQYSFGYYAGRYCEICWPMSGFRDARDPDAVFSELDAGESLHGED